MLGKLKTAGSFIAGNWIWFAVGFAVFLAAIGGAYRKGRGDGRDLLQAEFDRAALKAAQEDARLNDVADRERLSDDEAQDLKEATYEAAIAAAPPDETGAASRALNCARLRAAGVEAADLPAACGPTGGGRAEAPANP